MAFASQTRTATGSLKLDLSAAVYTLFSRAADYRAYRRTVTELSRLTSRELADLGLNRSTIRSTARAAVYGIGA